MCHVRKLVNRALFVALAGGWACSAPLIATAQAQQGGSVLAAPAESGPLLLVQTPSLSASTPAASAAPADPGPLLLAQAPTAAAPVVIASAAATADFGPLPRPAAPRAAASVVVASTAAPRMGQGVSALIEVAPAPAPVQVPLNSETLVLAAAPIAAQGAEPEAAASAAAAADWTKVLGIGLGVPTIAPIRWGGNTAVDLRLSGAQGQPRQTELVESVNLRANTYLWQPWIAQVSGELNLLTWQQHQGGDSQGGPGAIGGAMKTTTVTGGGQLALVPASRFPFSASFNTSDSRTSGELATSPYTSRRYEVTQSYSPPQSGSSYRLTYNRSDLTSAASGTDSAKALIADMNFGSGANSVHINGSAYANTAGNSGNSSSINTINATHSYRPNSELSLENLANYSSNQYNIANSGAASDLRWRFLQLNSFATWRPADNTPLLVTGGARLYQNSAGSNGVTSDSRTISANTAATYTLRPNTTLNAGGVVTHTSNGVVSNVFTSQTAGINHTGDTIKFGEYFYTWNTGANLGNQTGGESSGRNIDAQIGHRVNRNIALGDGSVVSMDASQNYSILRSTQFSTSQSLLNSAGASWSRTLGEGATTLLSLTASDSHTTGYTEQHFQMINMQASGQLMFSRESSASANLSLQFTRQTMSSVFLTQTDSTPAGNSGTSLSGNLSYQHTRAFGLPRLRYYALLNLNGQNAQTRLQGNIDAPVERVNWDFEQRLDYDIGRLEARLSLRLAEVAGRTNGMLFFRVMRQFGAL